MNTLHIYGQDAWHDSVILAGDRESLTALRSLIDRALVEGRAKAEFSCNDGEGYDFHVIPLSAEDCEKMPVPYTADYAADPGVDFREVPPFVQAYAIDIREEAERFHDPEFWGPDR